MRISDFSALQSLKDFTISDYLVRIAVVSQEMDSLKENLAANVLKRAAFLWLVHKTLCGSIKERDAIEKDWNETRLQLESKIEQALKEKDYTLIGQLSERLKTAQEHCDLQLEALNAEKGAAETKRDKLFCLTQRTEQLTSAILAQKQRRIRGFIERDGIVNLLSKHSQSEIKRAEEAAVPKRPHVYVVSSSYGVHPQSVDERAAAVGRRFGGVSLWTGTGKVQRFLRAVYRGELENVRERLKSDPDLVYTQGDFLDLSSRSFTRVTAFQYAVWALDSPMWTVILEYLPKHEAAAQLDAFAARLDLVASHGIKYSFAPLLAQYENYFAKRKKWSTTQLEHHWQQGVGVEQAKMPAWLIYAFTEPDDGHGAAWSMLYGQSGYSRVASEEFEGFQLKIKTGRAYSRGRGSQCGTCEQSFKSAHAQDCPSGGWDVQCIRHDAKTLTYFEEQSSAQYQLLTKSLTKTASSGSAPQTSHYSKAKF